MTIWDRGYECGKSLGTAGLRNDVTTPLTRRFLQTLAVDASKNDEFDKGFSLGLRQAILTRWLARTGGNEITSTQRGGRSVVWSPCSSTHTSAQEGMFHVQNP